MHLFGYYIAYPWLLLGLLLLPIIGWRFYQNQAQYFIQANLSEIKPLKRSSWKERGRYLIQLLHLFTLALLVIAASRPQTIREKESVKGEGIDIVLAMDVSVSMLAKDFEPDRLEASKRVAAAFVEMRKYDRIGLVVFAGESYTQCPLTTDHTVLLSFLNAIQCGLIKNGTAIGMGLANALNRLNEQNTKSKIIILLTDGMNNANYITPLQATNAVQKSGVRVYTIGVGTEGDARTPIEAKIDGTYIYGWKKVLIDEPLLKDIATKTGGQYYRAKDMDQLRSIYASIDQLEKSEILRTKTKHYTEQYSLFVYLALVFIIIQFILSRTIFKSIS